MKKVEKLEINKLMKADWNYKTDGTEEQITKLMNSIEYDNSAGVLAVRKVRNKYEVIDGNHRLEALKRLKWKEVQVENFGDLPKSKAIILSRRRNHVWFDDDLVSFGTLLKEDVLPDIGLDELKTILPDTSEEIENLLNFNKFDWTEPIQVDKGNNSSSKNLILQLGEDVFQMWQDWLKESGAKNESEAFYLLLKERNEEK
jgi:hypothetical protein|tara:strand:+ start:40 stop:642 length:603 start_codon:yes stop_codon:yes gene_type:complete